MAPWAGACGLIVFLVVSVILVGGRRVQAETCQVLRYTFQPECLHADGDPGCTQVFYRLDSGSSRNVVDRLDLGPQIAVWIESADRSRFIDTLMVTNMTAARGIGNRPGLAAFVSSPKFPYGKRQMALPIWAYSRGVLYPTVVFQDGNEERIGFHESCSSPDGYYCRPMRSEDIVDAVTCPSPSFNSSKGRIDPNLPKSFYPPRNDLGADPLNFIGRDCDMLGGAISSCSVSALGYSVSNDLDAVAAATPVYGQPYTGIWNIPASLAPGDYAVFVEVNKEFDRNAFHDHPSVPDSGLLGYGLQGNFGQPSVVYRVPIRIDGSIAATGAQSQIEGYSSWLGDSGVIIPRDNTISTEPGSGEGRLREINGPGGTGRVQISLEQCGPMVCDPPPPSPTMVSLVPVADHEITASTVTIHFRNASANGSPASGYEIRYLATADLSMTPEQFAQANRAPQVLPGLPDTEASFTLDSLKPQTHYVVGIRTQGPCMGQSDIAITDFKTPVMKFTQLSGCFVATAAYGSEMEPEVATLRSARDDLRPRSALFAAAIELYYRSGPAAAAVIGRSDTARALARRLIGPVAEIARAASQLPLARPALSPALSRGRATVTRP
jgi:hypothetical protein